MNLSHAFHALMPAGLALAIGIAAALGAASADAGTPWKWRDAQGRITISDVPPPRDIPERDVLQRPDGLAARTADTQASAAPSMLPAAPATTASAGGRGQPEARRAASAAEPASGAKVVEAGATVPRGEICARARQQLATLESGRRIARIDAQGGREVLDDAALAAEMRNARLAIASECR